MGKYIRALIAIVIGIAALVVALGMIQRETYSGSELSFTASRGDIVISNSGGEPITATITSRSTYRLLSSNRDVSITATRERVGSTTTYKYEGEFPASDLTLTVTAGTSITFALASEGALTAKTIPYSTNASIIIMVIAVGIFVGALYYASSTTGHRLVRKLVGGMPLAGRRMKTAPDM